jgi:uncharacterized membrane protein
MKKALFISMLITVGIIISSCNKKSDNTTSNTNNNVPTIATNNSPTDGPYNALGTISFTAGGVNYSCSITKVITAPTSLTFQTSTTDVRTNGSIGVTCYTATSGITTGTYSAATPAALSTVTFIDKTFAPYTATALTSGSSCAVNITALTSTSVKGTFTATVSKPIDNSKVNITNGVINCTITSKSVE